MFVNLMVMVIVVEQPLGRLIGRLDWIGGLESKVLGSLSPVKKRVTVY